MRTQGSFFADTGHSGGLLWYGASNVNWNGASLTYTRNAAGDYSLNLAASLGPFYITAGLADLKRLMINPDLGGMPNQEKFGTAGGTAGYPGSVAGLPPFSGATQLIPPLAQPPKGIRVNSIVVSYMVTVADVTTLSINLYRTTYADTVAPSVAAVALSANTLTKTFQATPRLGIVTVTTPSYETTDTSDLICEIGVTTPASSLFRFYGIGFYVDFNFN